MDFATAAAIADAAGQAHAEARGSATSMVGSPPPPPQPGDAPVSVEVSVGDSSNVTSGNGGASGRPDNTAVALEAALEAALAQSKQEAEEQALREQQDSMMLTSALNDSLSTVKIHSPPRVGKGRSFESAGSDADSPKTRLEAAKARAAKIAAASIALSANKGAAAAAAADSSVRAVSGTVAAVKEVEHDELKKLGDQEQGNAGASSESTEHEQPIVMDFVWQNQRWIPMRKGLRASMAKKEPADPSCPDDDHGNWGRCRTKAPFSGPRDELVQVFKAHGGSPHAFDDDEGLPETTEELKEKGLKWRWLGPWMVESTGVFGMDRALRASESEGSGGGGSGGSGGDGWLYAFDWPKNDQGYSTAGGKSKYVRCRRWVRPRELAPAEIASPNTGVVVGGGSKGGAHSPFRHSAYYPSAVAPNKYLAKSSSSIPAAITVPMTGVSVTASEALAAELQQAEEMMMQVGRSYSSNIPSQTLTNHPKSDAMQLRASDAHTGDGADGGAANSADGGGGDSSHSMGTDEADEQFDALLTLYYATGGVGWSRNKGWSLALRELSCWAGVTVSRVPPRGGGGGSVDKSDWPLLVETLRLSQNNLIGELPDDLGRLRALQVLNLSSNRLSGPLPDTIMSGLRLVAGKFTAPNDSQFLLLCSSPS